MNPLDDGVTHINIYSKGKTEIGRMLSNFYHSPFEHPVYGTFESVEGFWYWLGTGKKHKILKTLHGHMAKKAGREFEKVDTPMFEEHIKLALTCKLADNPNIVREIYKSSLPFEHYYYYGKEDNAKVYLLPEFKWICDFFENYRKRIKRS